jgi:hypothetical protein
MSPEKFALVIGLMVFAGGAVGLILQRVLPETFTTSGPRDMIGAVVGCSRCCRPSSWAS